MKNLIVYLAFPHHSNNHRPKILHYDFLILTIAFFLFLNIFYQATHNFYPNVLGIAYDITVEKIYNSTNQKRQENGLSPLSLNPQLSQAAAGKANDMFVENYWAHYSPSGKTPWDFIVGTGYNYLYAGENLAKDFGNSEGVVSAWMASPTHKDNILRPDYQDVGFAIVNGRLNGEETTLVVQLFGTKKTELAQAKKQVAIPEEAAFENIAPTLKPTIQPPTFTPTAKPALLLPPLTPTPALALLETKKSPPTAISNLQVGGASYRPFLDIFVTTKELSLFFLAVLVLVLLVDGIYIWRKKIFRISGRNLAHIIFLTSLIALIWLTGTGVIL